MANPTASSLINTKDGTSSTPDGMINVDTHANAMLQQALADAITKISSAQTGGNQALLTQKQNLTNQALNLSNPLNESPYKSLFQGMGYQAAGAEANTLGAFQPGLLSLENQASQNAAAAGNLRDTMSTIGQNYNQMYANQTSRIQALKEQVVPGNTLVNAATGTPIYGLGGGNGANDYTKFQNLQFSTGQGQKYAGEASDVATASSKLDQNYEILKQKAGNLDFSNYPNWNDLVKAYQQATGGAGDVISLQEAYNAFATTMSQLVNAGGAFTPSQVTDLTNKIDADRLNPSALAKLYETIKQTAYASATTKLEQAKYWEANGTNSPSSAVPTPVNVQEKVPVTYIVKKGDNLHDIAIAHQISLSDLEAANPQINPASNNGNPIIQPGDRLVLPVANTNKTSGSQKTFNDLFSKKGI